MPDPAGNGSSGYLWLYRFLHTIAGNITTAFGSKIPGLKTFTLILVALLAAATSACAARYTIHPGALNKTDSAAYDILLVAETAIDQARLAYKSRQLPAGVKLDRKSTRLNSSHLVISYAVFCLKKKKKSR